MNQETKQHLSDFERKLYQILRLLKQDINSESIVNIKFRLGESYYHLNKAQETLIFGGKKTHD